MNKQKIETTTAPAAVGPYSQAVAAGNFVFVSGQLPMCPKTGAMADAEIKTQTQQVIDNLSAVLKAAGGTLDDVIKTEVFLKDMNDFSSMNEVYAKNFSGAVTPARATIQAAKLPKDALVEISCVAYVA